MKLKFRIGRTKRSELLIGVMIGIYGNWLIAVLEKIGGDVTTQTGFFGVSIFFLMFYFMEAFTESEKQTLIGKIPMSVPLKTIFGLVHVLFVLASLSFAGIFSEEIVFTWFGVAIWVMLMSFERTGFEGKMEKID